MTRLQPPELDRAAPATLGDQIAAHYRAAIAAGQLRPGDRLPPIREVAEASGVTRAVVQDAYKKLSDAGLVAAEVGRGTTVLQSAQAAAPAGPLSAFAEAALLQTQAMAPAPPLPPGQKLVANFAELSPDAAMFPVDAMRAAMDAVLQRRGGELLGYGHAAAGMPELRELLCERARATDPAIAADDVLVTAGAQQGLDLVLRTFCTPGDAVLVTTPSYHQMYGLLKAHGLQPVPVAFGDDGLDLDQLERAVRRPGVRLCYLMPSFHNPTGRTLDEAQRRALLDVVGRTEVPILEDEYQDALRFRGTAPPSLRALDPRGLTVTVHTFSKDLFPGLRVGWVLGGARALQPMAAVKRFMDLETSPLLQVALCEFVRSGAYEQHLTGLTRELAARHATLQRELRPALPDGAVLTDPDGGFVAWLELPAAGPGASMHGAGDRLAELAAARGVRVVPGRAFDSQQRPSRGVRLSLSRADVRQTAAGARVLGELAQDLVRGAAPAPARHFL
ncbi:MAG: PLP-dependent aminotransferase family protein [Planctomycetota bacterium]